MPPSQVSAADEDALCTFPYDAGSIEMVDGLPVCIRELLTARSKNGESATLRLSEVDWSYQESLLNGNWLRGERGQCQWNPDDVDGLNTARCWFSQENHRLVFTITRNWFILELETNDPEQALIEVPLEDATADVRALLLKLFPTEVKIHGPTVSLLPLTNFNTTIAAEITQDRFVRYLDSIQVLTGRSPSMPEYGERKQLLWRPLAYRNEKTGAMVVVSKDPPAPLPGLDYESYIEPGTSAWDYRFMWFRWIRLINWWTDGRELIVYCPNTINGRRGSPELFQHTQLDRDWLERRGN